MTNFNFNIIKHKDGVVSVKFSGVMDVFRLLDFMKCFKSLCDNPAESRVVVDLSKVEYIASSGWRSLLSGRHALERHGGSMCIFGLHDGIRRVYDAMHIQSMLPVAKNFAEAQMRVKMEAITGLEAGPETYATAHEDHLHESRAN